jgi:hypothetical protein
LPHAISNSPTRCTIYKRLPELNRSTLYIPVQPRNSTVQCIFIANFASRVLVSTMVRHLPAQFPDVVPRLFGLAVHPANNRFSTLLFSASSELLFPQLLCFHNHLRWPLVFSSTSNFQVLRRHRSLQPANVQTFQRVDSYAVRGLRALVLSCLSFSHSSHLFSSACSLPAGFSAGLFSQNIGSGVGSLCESSALSAPQRYLFLSVVPPFPVSQSAQRGRLPHIQVSLLQAQGSQVNG